MRFSFRATAVLVLALCGVSPGYAEPFQTSTSALTNAANPTGFGLTLTTVPAGRSLVIEFFSAVCNPTGGGGVVPNPLRVTTNVDHWMALTPGSMAGLAVATHLTKIYADAGTHVNLTVFPTTAAATVSCNVSISGTLTTTK